MAASPTLEAQTFVERLRRERALAILRTDCEDGAGPAMEAAVEGGFRILEFTLDTPSALERIAEFSARPGLVVGAGTVLTVESAREALAAGATFLVSPVLDLDLVAEAAARGVAVLPGVVTPTEMLRAHRAGAPLQKLFPDPGAGPRYLRACLGPLPFLRLVPTNGVDAVTAPEWLAAGAWAVGFGRPLFEPEDVRSGRFARITAQAQAALRAVGSR